MTINISLEVSGFDGSEEELAKLLRSMPGVLGVKRTANRADGAPELPTAERKSPPEAISRADKWLNEQMQGRDFIPSEDGKFKLGGRLGYFKGGPGSSATTIYNFFRADPEIIFNTEPFAHHPGDLHDVQRCRDLFERVPEWESRILELSALSPTWQRFAESWEQLDEAMNSKNEKLAVRILNSCLHRTEEND